MKFVSIDFETANRSRLSICDAGLAVVDEGISTESVYWLARPPKGRGFFWDEFIAFHHLTHLDVLDAPEFPAIAPKFLSRLERADFVVAHNAEFYIGQSEAKKATAVKATDAAEAYEHNLTIQNAADLELPATDPVNAPTRAEFKLGIFPADHHVSAATPTPPAPQTPGK